MLASIGGDGIGIQTQILNEHFFQIYLRTACTSTKIVNFS